MGDFELSPSVRSLADVFGYELNRENIESDEEDNSNKWMLKSEWIKEWELLKKKKRYYKNRNMKLSRGSSDNSIQSNQSISPTMPKTKIEMFGIYPAFISSLQSSFIPKSLTSSFFFFFFFFNVYITLQYLINST
jgi:hypothetical protein